MSGIGAWYRQCKTSTSILTKYRHRYRYWYRCIPNFQTSLFRCLGVTITFSAAVKLDSALSASGKSTVSSDSVPDSDHGYMDSNNCLSRTEIALSVSCKHLTRIVVGPHIVGLTPLDNSMRSS